MNKVEIMNEYEILKDQLFNERETYNFIDKLGYDDWNKKEVIRKYIKHIRQQNKELHNKIDKAIEYIEHFSKDSEIRIYGIPATKVFIGDMEQLLEILKGETNE